MRARGERAGDARSVATVLAVMVVAAELVTRSWLSIWARGARCMCKVVSTDMEGSEELLRVVRDGAVSNFLLWLTGAGK
jgi:hypothetical protein